MNNRTVLISGAGIAGPTLAYWLARHGYRPTVVERSAALRSSGSPVDVRGRAVEVAEQMGVMPRLREAATDVTGIRFVNATGRHAGRIDLQALQRASASRDVELPRGDLASILYQASRDSAEYLFHDSIVGLSQDEDGVNVTFDRVQPRRFDLVIGADGLHSAVRRLAFGPESDFVRHAGLYVATLPLEGHVESGRDVLIYNAPGRAVSIHPSRGSPLAAFIFRSPAVPDFDHRDTAQHKRLLMATYADDAWRVPELLSRVRDAADLYFDSVSQVRLDPWWRGRVALLGDAASCVSLFGDGSTLAMAGAFTLAQALEASPGDHRLAFRRYEAEHRRLVDPRQRSVGLAASLIVPATQSGILTRNLASQLWPVAAAAGWLRSRLVPHRAAA
ncbi:FAD-dependent monooxygenase [Vitiosangium sp. GDMCC 1.1324]|uniref:FAD-dependent monooxygenase n=1 Tax=Vitiosangium sp. (strain GDMCC 1.1324) TaxID=2138576 RepID=UPI000D3AFC5D|nr:FAD-dependent monooxygenase [Vitiosangium sp. GDMCC 1.1324]PTL78793.1 monooxygenase [Vitiosangium sp. GDMCC 1.1324]